MSRLHPLLACVVSVGLGVMCADVSAETSDGTALPSTTPEAAASAPVAARHAHRLVYSCRDGSIPMFADRPCGEVSLLRSLDVFIPAQGGKPPTTVAEPARAATKPAHREIQARTLQETAEKCERLQKSLDDIDDRMRAGYPARQAAQIWQRWRDARAAVREAGC